MKFASKAFKSFVLVKFIRHQLKLKAQSYGVLTKHRSLALK